MKVPHLAALTCTFKDKQVQAERTTLVLPLLQALGSELPYMTAIMTGHDGHIGPSLRLEFVEAHLALWTWCRWRPAHMCRDLGCVLAGHLTCASGRGTVLQSHPCLVNDTASCRASMWQECSMDLKIFALCQLYINNHP